MLFHQIRIAYIIIMKFFPGISVCLLLFFECSWLCSFAQVTLPSIFTDNMVLQQKESVLLWGWSKPGKAVTVTSSWNNQKVTTVTDSTGKWHVKITTATAGGPYTIVINDGKPVTMQNVLLGEVWLCSGQSNMEMPMKGFKGQPVTGSNDAILKSSNSSVRLYTVPRSAQTSPQQNSKPSAWREAEPESVSNFSATAYYFGRLLNELLHVPIGLINTSYGGSDIESWMSANTLKTFAGVNIPNFTDSIKSPNHTPTVLYNGMVHPIIGYGIRGAIWYQGESNYDRPAQYIQRFAAMVNEWRILWDIGAYPFYYAQLAPYNYATFSPPGTPQFNSALLRDAQRKAQDSVAGTAMAVLMDIGEENSIHPANKKTGGERLAYLALAKTYGIKGFGAESPAYDSLMIKDSIAIVRFKNAGNWLTSYGKELIHFEVAGKDKMFYPAKAVIYRTTVVVSSPLVRQPVAVRYAFKDFVTGELFGTEGLPVSSFRTDDW
ncbi:MAG: 9-O-acetylesterase [Ferruginibacter sp.]|nr:9-O-acetylesterase [Ferruginibacter sp.]